MILTCAVCPILLAAGVAQLPDRLTAAPVGDVAVRGHVSEVQSRFLGRERAWRYRYS